MENNNYFKCVLKGTAGTLLFSFVGIVILSSLMTKLVLSKSVFNMIYIMITLVSLAIGSVIAARRKKSKGMLVGFGVTALYFVIIYIIYAIINGGISFNMFEVLKVVTSLIVGGLAGILGVNMGE